MKSWELWLEEFISLDQRLHGSGEPLSVREEHQHEYLRNLLEGALGTKTTLQEDNRRSNPRIPVALPISLSWEGGQLEAFTINLSWDGIQVDDSTPNGVPKLSLRIAMEQEGIEFESSGRVVWQGEEAMGIAFEEISEDQRKVLGVILSKLLRDRISETLSRTNPKIENSYLILQNGK